MLKIIGIKRRIRGAMKNIIITTVKGLIYVSILLILIFLFIDQYIVGYSKQFILSDSKLPEAQTAIVLGARVYPNDNLSVMLQDRMDHGIYLYQIRKVPTILLSGDHGHITYDEVNAMKNYAHEKNVQLDDIFLDHAGFNTYNSIYRAKEVFKTKKIIIVTQKYHLYRAIYIARTLGIEAYGKAADNHRYPRMDYYEFRERFARVKDFLALHVLKTKPKFLGKEHPITGSGRSTHD